MSTKYPGGLITKNPVTPAGPYETGAAPGVWTVEQALQYTKQGIWPTAGNVPINYIEDVFSTYLYNGTAAVQSIINGIDLAGKGGMFLLKGRSGDWSNYGTRAVDTARGSAELTTNSTNASTDLPGAYTFNSNGFTLPGLGYNGVNGTNTSYASWTFRKQPKFFDVVTYTGNGDSNRNIPHGLGSVPGCIIVKETDAANGWAVYHRTLADGDALQLQSTGATASTNFFGPNSAQTATVFQTGSSNITYTNGTDKTYVAYLFAHDAGGFGLTGTDNVISCGSYTGNGSFPNTITLGYEPQWVMIKKANAPSGINTGWVMFDNMRGMGVVGTAPSPFLYANASDAESSSYSIGVTATGFEVSTQNIVNTSGDTYIYIAIRRGPMKVPTNGTSIFAPIARTGTGSSSTVNAGFTPDLVWETLRSGASLYGPYECDRLRGSNVYLTSTSTTVEASAGGLISFDAPNGYFVGNNTVWEGSGNPISNWAFKRAPGFFDEVCYTGSGSPTTRNHNLTVIPELVIIKSRSGAGNWSVASKVNATEYARSLPGTASPFTLNSDNASSQNVDMITGGQMAATTFVPYVLYGTSNDSEQSGVTYVAYLFATCAGVSKVGTYSGTGATQTISCGFTGGARFVLIKSTDLAANWFVWDTARGMVAGTDPRLALNTTAAESNANWVYTTTGGFQIVSTAADINASGSTYIFLAIA